MGAINPTIQPTLSLSAARIRRPALDRRGAIAVLDEEDWQLETIIYGPKRADRDALKLTGVIDIASRGVNKQELRFLVICLTEYKRGELVPRTAEDLAQLFFGLPQPLVRARWVYRGFACHETHLYDLHREGVLKMAKGCVQRSGPGGGGVFEWDALVDFIKKRRIA